MTQNVSRWLAASVILMSTLAGAEAFGQEALLVAPQARQGYYISLGSGAAINDNQSTEDEFDTLVGAVFSLRAGEMINDWIGAGLRIGGGSVQSSDWSAGFGGLQLETQLVPLPRLAVHAGVGAGGFSVSATDPDGDDGLKGTGGAYYSVGVSYDTFPFHDVGSGGFAVTPALRVSYMPGEVFEATIVTFGIQAVWWTGLEKNKLDLSFDESYTPER